MHVEYAAVSLQGRSMTNACAFQILGVEKTKMLYIILLMPLAHWMAGSRAVPEASSSLGNVTLVSVLMWLVCVPVQVMFLPQRPVAAPGKTLLEQLIYPAVMPEEGSAVDLQHLAHLLQQVGLTELLQRVQGDWRLSQNWQGRNLLFMLGCHGAPHVTESAFKACPTVVGDRLRRTVKLHGDMHVSLWSTCC